MVRLQCAPKLDPFRAYGIRRSDSHGMLESNIRGALHLTRGDFIHSPEVTNGFRASEHRNPTRVWPSGIRNPHLAERRELIGRLFLVAGEQALRFSLLSS